MTLLRKLCERKSMNSGAVKVNGEERRNKKKVLLSNIDY